MIRLFKTNRRVVRRLDGSPMLCTVCDAPCRSLREWEYNDVCPYCRLFAVALVVREAIDAKDEPVAYRTRSRTKSSL